MRIRRFIPLFALVACSSSPTDTWVADFHPPALMPGYTRFVTPTIEGIQPGDNLEYCQWLAAPSDQDQDVLAMTGAQSKTGHHAILYSNSETNFKVGESHLCTTDDMLQIAFVGAIGGEGTASASSALPDGVYFRLPAGKALMVNTHWLNQTDSMVDGQSVIDVKFAPRSDSRIIADLFANNGDTFSIDSGSTATYDVTCPLTQDLSFVLTTNHMHGYGTSIYTEIVKTDGTKQMILANPTWTAESQFNPTYMQYPIDTPLVVHAGDSIHTHCEWHNTTSSKLLFPDEMCVGIGFYFPSQGQLTCENGGLGHSG
jgi:hypothetical protein